MTRQEVFNTVVKHLMTQRKQSIAPEHGCAYRGDNGLKCAVGVLINDECYDERFEGETVNDPFVQRALSDSCVPMDYGTVDMLFDLQCIHDSSDYEFINEASYHLTNVHRRIAEVAKDYDLTLDESLLDQ